MKDVSQRSIYLFYTGSIQTDIYSVELFDVKVDINGCEKVIDVPWYGEAIEENIYFERNICTSFFNTDFILAKVRDDIAGLGVLLYGTTYKMEDFEHLYHNMRLNF